MKILSNLDGADKLKQDSGNRFVTDEQIAKWNASEINSKAYIDGKVKSDVPLNAKFTDTITTINGQTGDIELTADDLDYFDYNFVGGPKNVEVTLNELVDSNATIGMALSYVIGEGYDIVNDPTLTEILEILTIVLGNYEIGTAPSLGEIVEKISNIGGGSIVDLGTFNDEEEVITRALMNQLPTGYYTFIMDDLPYVMTLKEEEDFYLGKAENIEGTTTAFQVTKTGEIIFNYEFNLYDDYMPRRGGVLETYSETFRNLIGTSPIINLSYANVFTHSLTGNTTYSITNAENGQAHSFTLIINMGSTVRTLTFPASVKWQDGAIPDMTTPNKTYVLTFMSVDGGSTWLGMFGGEF